MTTDQSDGADFRKSLLTSPGECQDVEYKSAIPFDDNTAFGLRLVKHILGMANVGGGWIVIGYKDGPLQVDHNHSQKIAATYDTTRLSAAVDKYVHGDRGIRLTVFVEIHPTTQLPHPIIRIQGLERTPFICRSTKGVSDANQPILQTGKVYIRRPGAATSEIQTPSEWEDLLKRCVSQRRDEFLSDYSSMNLSRSPVSRRMRPSGTPTVSANCMLAPSLRSVFTVSSKATLANRSKFPKYASNRRRCAA